MVAKALSLTPKDKLAVNCPLCFGPKVPGKRIDEPDCVICMDGNFQHRRHQAASASWRGESGVVPSLFISPDHVKTWQDRMGDVPGRADTSKKEPDEVIVSDLVLAKSFHLPVLTNLAL